MSIPVLQLRIGVGQPGLRTLSVVHLALRQAASKSPKTIKSYIASIWTEDTTRLVVGRLIRVVIGRLRAATR
jgi:hypothetical protein